MKKILFLFLFVNLQVQSFAQVSDSLSKKAILTQEYQFSNGVSRSYPKPKFLDVVTKAPRDFLNISKDFVAKDHAWYLGGSIAATGLLVPVDQQITDKSRAWANNNGFSPDNIYGTFGPLQNIPKNPGAGIYLLGNGSTVILLGVGFATFGLLKNDFRAKATASGLIESLLVSGVYVQTLKRITGRESPFIAIQNGNPGGDWNPFPSFSAYAKNTPSYDAVPSGHLTTIMSALTIIITNYPDYKWLKPVCYTAMAGLCFQMVQSEVHWASDYPLAILMGYFIGKNIARNRFKETKKTDGTEKKYTINYTASRNYGYNMVGATVNF